MPEPVVLGGAALLLMMMLGGKKKKGGPVGPLAPGDKPTPLPPGHQAGPSDPLPGGSKYGHLPKDKGYAPPPDMTTTDIWISPDCQGYLVGADWLPSVGGGMEPGMWLHDVFLSGGGTPWLDWIVEQGPFGMADMSESRFMVGYLYGRYPDLEAPMDNFARSVLSEASPLCAETMPHQWDFGEANMDEDAFRDAYTAWAQEYPEMDKLMGEIIREAAGVEEGTGDYPIIEIADPADPNFPFQVRANMNEVWDVFVFGYLAEGIEFNP